ncbi:MAG: UDP-N-acetylmuramoyl-L-alanyl-D-glutamate--2,6-diaminopimelate ligase [Actinomycetota bacterium]
MGPGGQRMLAEVAGWAGDLLTEVTGDPSTGVAGLAYDSARVAPGDLFFCIKGARSDGHRFAAAARAAGAASLCVERPTGAGLPEVVVTDARVAMPRIAAGWFGRPADDLLMLGVTGTNGKTTTTFLIESILRSAGMTTGLIGTIETRIAGRMRPGVRTTPESLDLQGLLAEMRDARVEAVAMEVTSHALVLHRVEGVRFASATFTNLSQDHLDFHRDMEDYFAAKRSLFTSERAERGAANVDDPYGRKLKETAGIPTTGFGCSPDAEVRAEKIASGPSGTRFVIVTPRGEIDIETGLVGGFNVSNCLAAAAAALEADIAPDAVAAGIRALRAVPGRFEAVDEGQPFTVVVDYAHTPDSLDNVLSEARRVVTARGAEARVVCVFGCGGDRDPGKRPLMGAVAARLADVVVVTSDNPRSEPPEKIIDEIVEGFLAVRSSGPDEIVADRRAAIAWAVGRARPNDVVVIAGKGHESVQELADRTVPFDDRDVARRALRALDAAGAR